MHALDVPADIWSLILQYLDNQSLQHCRNTCRSFKSITDDNSFWIQRAANCKNANVLPNHKWRHAACNNEFERENVSAEESEVFKFNYKQLALTKKGYSTIKPYNIHRGMSLPDHSEKYKIEFELGGDGISIENNETGCDPDDSVENCFALSFRESKIKVFIDLVALGIDPWVLDHVRPTIRVSQKVNHRYDCGAYIALGLQLGRYRKPVVNALLHSNERDLDEDKTFGVVRKEWEQWSAPDWEDISVELNDYPSGMRYATIITSGSDNQFWKGFFGPKIANLELNIILPEKTVVKELRTPLECEERPRPVENEEGQNRRMGILQQLNRLRPRFRGGIFNFGDVHPPG